MHRPGRWRKSAAAAIAAACAALCVSVPAAQCAVAVLHDDSGADAKFSRSRAENVRRLLAEAGIESEAFPVSSLESALAPPAAVAHFVWVSKIPPAGKAALSKYAARGGKVVVHGSFSADLAEICGLAPPRVEYVEPPPGGVAWTGFAFDGPPPLDAPRSVENRVGKV
ncbi:MAG: hypothetical protein IJ678_09080, partial [Kiritimatiellae bacterium]|nr:hypothetical protein [Kiritimatiellia bacterium]